MGKRNKKQEYQAFKESNKYTQIVAVILGAIILVAISITQAMLSQISDVDVILFNLGEFGISKQFLMGVLAQIQLLTSAAMTIIVGKTGYLVSGFMNGFSAARAIVVVALTGEVYIALGAVVPAGAVIITTILYIYSKTVKKANDQFEFQAYHDLLTTLPNRRFFSEVLEKTIKEKGRKHQKFAIIFIDIDNFKLINDSAGHERGDQILQRTAVRLKSMVDKRDFVSRFGGDEFLMLVNRDIKEEELVAYINTIRDSLVADMNVNNTRYNIQASFGIAKFPEDGECVQELLMCADTAMYGAKDSGRNTVKVFEASMRSELVRRMQLETSMPRAWDNGEMYLRFQPQYNLEDHSIRGVEVLVRWDSKELGSISPVEFIPLAEKTKLIVPMGEWILRSACEWYVSTQLQNKYPFLLCVNISPVQMFDKDFYSMVERVLRETNMPPEYLEFEITESLFIASLDYVEELLKKLKLLGILVALDDFGAGYSSLSYISKLSLDTIKVDKCFIDEIRSLSDDYVISGIIALVHKLGMEVVAEGVENKVQFDYLKEENCDCIQGFLLGKPMLGNEIEQIVNK